MGYVSSEGSSLSGNNGLENRNQSFVTLKKTEGNVEVLFDYQGLLPCTAAKQLGSPDACANSCIGLGDCLRVCPFGAMYMAHGQVHVNLDKCTGCGMCVRVCPNNILEIVPLSARVMVLCSSRDKGKVVSDICGVGCISCMRCLKDCPCKCIQLEGGVIRIDHAACIAYGPSCLEVCAEKCPRGIIQRLESSAAARDEAARQGFTQRLLPLAKGVRGDFASSSARSQAPAWERKQLSSSFAAILW
jgi:electron transport complex protein RnfB